MKEVIILGIGNRLMMDDGIGVRVVEELSSRNTHHNVHYVVGETDIYYCMQQIRESSNIIIVDAARLGNKPGAVNIIPLQNSSSNLIQSLFAHESHILNEIKLIGKNINGIFIGIEPYKIEYSINLSPVLQEQFFTIVDIIGNIIKTYIKDLLLE